VNDSLFDHDVDEGHRLRQELLGLFQVRSFQSLAEPLDLGSQTGAVRPIANAALLILPDALDGGKTMSQWAPPVDAKNWFYHDASNLPNSLARKEVWDTQSRKQGQPDHDRAIEFAKRMAEAGWMAFTEAGSGIMKAAHENSDRILMFGVNIKLPF
jgi:hypothetical protein